MDIEKKRTLRETPNKDSIRTASNPVLPAGSHDPAARIRWPGSGRQDAVAVYGSQDLVGRIYSPGAGSCDLLERTLYPGSRSQDVVARSWQP